MSHLWQQAAAFAARAHRNQVRKDGVTPYVSHPVRVTMTVALVFGETDEHLLAAALLHDTIEDTATDYDELLETFGSTVADAVAAMSKDMRLIEPKREAAYDEQLANGPWQGRMIKLGDVYDNLMDTYEG
jgi:guanosine-3',5'-bis(diphosphate) 3'-pyrophosphohydrolase